MKIKGFTIKQILLLPLIFLMWLRVEPKERNSWKNIIHNMKNPHKCDFQGMHYVKGFWFRKCTHEGCNTYEPID